MANLEGYICTLRKEIVDEIGAENIRFAKPDELTDKLNELFPLEHEGVKGQLDMMHVIWARTLKDLVWLGCLTEAKRRRGVYDDVICRAVEKSFMEAFYVGKKYAEERP